MTQAYAQIQDLTLKVEQGDVTARELENQIALANEELEATVTQLDETGRHLDEVNEEVTNMLNADKVVTRL